jgi:hypothetical protein
VWSTGDDVILFSDLVWGSYTSQLPGQDAEKRYATLGHLALKSQVDVLIGLVSQHAAP